MLTAFQTVVVAYAYEGGVVCDEHRDEAPGAVEPLIQYVADEQYGEDGLSCDHCGAEIIEPPTPHERLDWGIDDLETHVQVIHGDPAGENAAHDIHDHDHEH